MGMISVKAVPGRIARTAPDGDFIPDDKFVLVHDTPYIQRLLNVHGDITLEPKRKKPEPAEPMEVAEEKPPKPKGETISGSMDEEDDRKRNSKPEKSASADKAE